MTADDLLREARLLNMGWAGLTDWAIYSVDLTIKPDGVRIMLCQAGCMSETPVYTGTDYDEAGKVMTHLYGIEPDGLRNLIHLYGE